MTGLTAILPACNEEVAIGSMVLHSKQHVDRGSVVDDSSTDATAAVAGLAGGRSSASMTPWLSGFVRKIR